MAIIKRLNKGSKLTHQELDNNFSELEKASADTGNPKLDKAVSRVYGTKTTPITGNITIDETNSVLGGTVFIFHKAATKPTISSTTEQYWIGGTEKYVPDQVNVIGISNVGGVLMIAVTTNTASVSSTTNSAPTDSTESYSVDENQTLTVDAANGILANASDADGDNLTAELVTDVANGALTLNADGSFTYTPTVDYFGADSFVYKSHDGTEYGPEITVDLTVNEVVVVNFPAWTNEGDDGSAFMTGINAELPKASIDNTLNEFPTAPLDTGADFWFGSLAPNGKIYCVPSESTYVLVIDVPNQTTYKIGTGLPATNYKYWGSALANNGCVYGFPYDGGNILKIDTTTDTVTTVSAPSQKTFGAVAANNGFIYTVPYLATSIIKFNPDDDTYTTFAYTGAVSDTTYRDGVLAPNGCIYYLPYNTKGRVLKLDPTDDSTVEIGTDYGTGTNKWSRGGLALNGKIYSYGNNTLGILEIDPETDTTRIISHTITTGGSNPVNLIDGKILFPGGSGSGNSKFIIFDTSDDSLTEGVASNLYGNSQQWILAHDGNVYGIPDSRNVQKFGANAEALPTDMVVSRFINK